MINRKRTLKIVSIALGAVFLLLVGASIFGVFYISGLKKQEMPAKDPASYKFTQDEMVKLNRPGTVRIIQHAKGKVLIPKYNIDLLKRVMEKTTGEPKEISFDVYYSGTGFFVNPDGYILTNSHVVSRRTAVYEKVAEEAISLIMDDALKISNSPARLEEAERIESEIGELETGELYEEFGKKIVEDMIADAQASYDEKSIIVLDPTSSQSGKLSELVKSGIAAKMVSVNDDYYKDEKDVALIKIEGQNFPSMLIGDDALPEVGRKVFVFGFPSNADFNSNSLLESTFSLGNIGSLKNSRNNDFKIIQTDAKVSAGSSGGPMFDEFGKVIGIVTFQTSSDEEGESGGDNFAFAIPSKIVKSSVSGFVISKDLVPGTLNSSPYLENTMAGLSFKESAQCKRAIGKLQLAKVSNEKFQVDKEFFDSKIAECEKMIVEGDSIDTRWDAKRKELGISEKAAFVIMGVILGGYVLISVAVLLILRLTRKEVPPVTKENPFYEESVENKK